MEPMQEYPLGSSRRRWLLILPVATVTSTLHIVSKERGIQVLALTQFRGSRHCMAAWSLKGLPAVRRIGMLFDLLRLVIVSAHLNCAEELGLECDSYNGDVKSIMSTMVTPMDSSKPRICMTRVATDQEVNPCQQTRPLRAKATRISPTLSVLACACCLLSALQ